MGSFKFPVRVVLGYNWNISLPFYDSAPRFIYYKLTDNPLWEICPNYGCQNLAEYILDLTFSFPLFLNGGFTFFTKPLTNPPEPAPKHN